MIVNPAQSYRVLVTGIDGARHLCRALTSDRADLDVEIIEPDAETIPLRTSMEVALSMYSLSALAWRNRSPKPINSDSWRRGRKSYFC
jgi:hypothetical protein